MEAYTIPFTIPYNTQPPNFSSSFDSLWFNSKTLKRKYEDYDDLATELALRGNSLFCSNATPPQTQVNGNGNAKKIVQVEAYKPPTKQEKRIEELTYVKKRKLERMEKDIKELAVIISQSKDSNVLRETEEEIRRQVSESLDFTVMCTPSNEYIMKIIRDRGYKGKAEFQDVQFEGIKFALEKFNVGKGCIISHEMGLGKTLLSLGLERIMSLRRPGTTLIIAPSGVSHNWKNECLNYFGNRIRILLFVSQNKPWWSYGGRDGSKGSKSSLEITSRTIESYDLVITHYDALTTIWSQVVRKPVRSANAKLTSEYLKQFGTNLEATQKGILVDKFPKLDWSKFERSNANSKWLNVSVKPNCASVPMVGALLGHHWNMIILDEGHVTKTPDSRKAEMVRSMMANNKLLLTGTPVFNSLNDLWSLFRFIEVPGLESFKDFCNTTKWLIEEMNVEASKSGEASVGQGSSTSSTSEKEDAKRILNGMEKLRTKYEVAAHMLNHRDHKIKVFLDTVEKWVQRITKNDVAKNELSVDEIMEEQGRYKDQGWTMIHHSLNQIPPVYQKVVRIDPYSVLLKIHESIRQGKKNEFQMSEKKARSNLLGETINYLRMLVSHPNNVSDAIYTKYCKEEDVKLLKEAELQKFSELITYYTEEVQPYDQKIIVFSWFKETARYVRDKLNELDIPCEYVDGEFNSEKKLKVCEKFSKSGKYRALSATYCISTGFNIVGANHVAFWDYWWNEPMVQQSYSRVARPGQENDIRVLVFLLQNTIDEKIHKIASNKANISSGLTNKVKKDLLGF